MRREKQHAQQEAVASIACTVRVLASEAVMLEKMGSIKGAHTAVADHPQEPLSAAFQIRRVPV